jgi:hypothetical protein
MTPNAKRPIAVDDAYSNGQAKKHPKVGSLHWQVLVDAAARSTDHNGERVDSVGDLVRSSQTSAAFERPADYASLRMKLVHYRVRAILVSLTPTPQSTKRAW